MGALKPAVDQSKEDLIAQLQAEIADLESEGGGDYRRRMYTVNGMEVTAVLPDGTVDTVVSLFEDMKTKELDFCIYIFGFRGRSLTFILMKQKIFVTSSSSDTLRFRNKLSGICPTRTHRSSHDMAARWTR